MKPSQHAEIVNAYDRLLKGTGWNVWVLYQAGLLASESLSVLLKAISLH
jgi:hypothetical protein